MQALNELLEATYALAVSAGERIMGIYQNADFSVQEKSDESPLTAADLASHHLLCEGLAKLTPEIPILFVHLVETSHYLFQGDGDQPVLDRILRSPRSK